MKRTGALRALATALIAAFFVCMGGQAFGADIDALIADMSLGEKVSQLFFVQPEHFSRIEKVTAGSAKLKRAFRRFPVGGVILFKENMKNKKTLTALNNSMQAYAKDVRGIGLLIGVDEEGGGVSRAADRLKLKEKQPYASDIGALGSEARALEAGTVIGTYLKDLGFNLDFAPVADVRSEVRDAEIVRRAFSDDADTVSVMATAFVRGLHSQGIMSVAKHFPGHGAVSGNTHGGPGLSQKTAEDWRAWDFKPFRAAIGEGVDMVMISHQLAVNVDKENPASLSPAIVTGLLRGELSYDGVVITDALRMGAIHEEYGSGEACVRALEAGCDMLLLPYNFTNGYNGVMKALREGRLTESRIDESVRRILLLKQRYGLIADP